MSASASFWMSITLRRSSSRSSRGGRRPQTWRLVVVGNGRLLRLAVRVGHGLPHRGREIHEKGRGDLATRAIVAHVDALARRQAGADVAARLDGAVEVDLLPVRDLAHALGRLGLDVLELPPHAREKRCVPVVYRLPGTPARSHP